MRTKLEIMNNQSTELLNHSQIIIRDDRVEICGVIINNEFLKRIDSDSKHLTENVPVKE